MNINTVEKYEKDHSELSCFLAQEGIVLLKNENLLPLRGEDSIGLFGGGARHTIKGGTGSGDVNERDVVNIEQGLKNCGFKIDNVTWLNEYDAVYDTARTDWTNEIHKKAENMRFIFAYFSTPFRTPIEPLITEEMVQNIEIVIYVLSRISGEGVDRKYEKGDFLLTDEEKENLSRLDRWGKKVALVINSGGLIELSEIEQFNSIKAIVYFSQAGMRGGNALANILCGKSIPSGKLSVTWGWDFAQWDCSKKYSDTKNNDKDYYTDGIFVGYRWFDAFEKKIRYPFGYGLSYTNFNIQYNNIKLEDDLCKVEVDVENTGNEYSGKEVVQLYLFAPNVEGVDREIKKLVSFNKTSLLSPGKSETICCEFTLQELCRYDDAIYSWVADAGNYVIAMGNNASELKPIACIKVEQYNIVKELSSVCPLTESLILQQPIKNSEISCPTDIDVITVDKIVAPNVNYKLPSQPDVDTLTRDELVSLVVGKINGDGNHLGVGSDTVPGAAGEIVGFPEKNISKTILADGPAGIRLTKKYEVDENDKPAPQEILSALEGGLFAKKIMSEDANVKYQNCTSFPVGTLLAQTWDPKLMEKFGEAVAIEMMRYGVHIWLAPGMNIQRSPLCGRNFEYFSEDPLLTGKIACGIVKGVESFDRCGVTIKHFACNNQEDNRHGIDAIVSQRALREIYFKGFEIAVKESNPTAIMTSYNKINGVYSANNFDLCTTVAREEWGFKGLIMTDWATTVSGASSHRCIAAGNDLIMPGMPIDKSNILSALENGELTMDMLKSCAARVVNATRLLNM